MIENSLHDRYVSPGCQLYEVTAGEPVLLGSPGSDIERLYYEDEDL